VTRQLVLVRHGQSLWNVERRVQGQSGSGLSDTGREQAARTAAVVAAAHPDAVLWASDLDRCVETAAPFVDALGAEPTLDPGLRERDFAAWSGRLIPEIAEGWPDLYDRWRAGEDVVGEVGGETSDALAVRVAATLRRLLDASDPERPVVCITHGGPVWYGTHELVGLPRGSLGAVGNASVTRLETNRETTRLGSWNEVSHLPPALRSSLQPTGHHRTAAAPPVGR
jgi:broad specificity phosphatase PhoE